MMALRFRTVRRARRPRPRAFTVALLGGLLACNAPGGPDRVHDRDWRVRPDGDVGFGPVGAGPLPAPGTDAAGAPLPPPPPAACRPANAQPLPARIDVMSGQAVRVDRGPRQTTHFTRDLYDQFKSFCGACHVETKLGNYQVNGNTFRTLVDEKVVALMKSDDPTKFMPPPAGGGKAYSQRTPGDPVVALVKLLEAWIAQGRPDTTFTIETQAPPSQGGGGGEGEGVVGYLVPEDVGKRLTNIGDCVPNATLFAASRDTMDKKDALFAAMTELPETLSATDLDTLDGETLAANGVIAYAPAYPLWTDESGKLRHIRIPRGTSIRFDRATQSFEMPPNSRLYKTFLKKIVDREGRESYRKIETRVIVARPDRTLPDGSAEVTALFGTYVWNEDETEARLLQDPLRNGKPFRDRMLTYVTDEPKAKKIRDSNPANLAFALEEENPGLLRHYAIPGSERCIHCHMGSPTNNFVLGFFPLQILRRENDIGAEFEPTGPDEATQLQRFLDYGLITGMRSPADVLPIERSQPGREARNEYELKAQAYLLGNCAHCHNPRGFPSVKSPELKDALDFLPSAKGGVFRFPLDRMSPLRKRGVNLDVPMPYITPSLREYPVANADTPNWTAKWAHCATDPTFCFGYKTGVKHYDAPWRSLIYRNVEAPFAYADDFVIYPRMPMHSPGHDCRGARVMAEWMVTIPAVRKHPEIAEDAVPAAVGAQAVKVDTEAQPYREVLPHEEEYAAGLRGARARLQAYRAGVRYDFCPTEGDIVDPVVRRRTRRGDPMVPPAGPVFDKKDPTRSIQPDTGVPIRPHWVVTDLTEPPGDWYPRRPDWEPVLVEKKLAETGLPAAERAEQAIVIDALQGVSLNDALRAFATTEIPFGLWQTKPGCDLSAQPKAGDFQGDRRPRWMDVTEAKGDAPVYMWAPGAAIFNTICVNCHGPQADSTGIMAEAILNMTGGDARVANLRDGLLGGNNRGRVFGPAAGKAMASPGSAEDWAARYMAWMALGGTQRVLPAALLNIVAATRVLGEARATNRISPTGSPNMLKLAQELCTHVLPANINTSGRLEREFFRFGTPAWSTQTGLIARNADAEMWLRLCSLGNRPVVRVPHVPVWDESVGVQKPIELDNTQSFYWGDAYPADAPVLDHRGRVVKGIGPDNLFPLCFRKPTDPKELAVATKFLEANRVGGPNGSVIPFCPDALFQPDPKKWQLEYEFDRDTSTTDLIDANKWATRGAINAGLAVYLYLDQLSKRQVEPKPAFNQCEQLKKGAGR
jgi:mono/diheme cytochrome c family protein